MAAGGPARTVHIEHASGLGTWRLALRRPGGALNGLVSGLNAYTESGTGPLRRRELPTGEATLVFNLGDELGVALRDEAREVFRAGQAFFSGAGDRFASTDTAGAQSGAQVMLTPLGARRLLGLPLSEVQDQPIDPEIVLGRPFRDLRARIEDAPSAAARLDLLEATLRRRLADGQGPPADIAFALERLERTRGRVSIARLALEIDCSRRHLTRRFVHEFGLAPKRFAQLLRFSDAIEALKAGRVRGRAELADICGYADQAHLTRAFVAFAGDPPQRFAARGLPDRGGFRD